MGPFGGSLFSAMHGSLGRFVDQFVVKLFRFRAHLKWFNIANRSICLGSFRLIFKKSANSFPKKFHGVFNSDLIWPHYSHLVGFYFKKMWPIRHHNSFEFLTKYKRTKGPMGRWLSVCSSHSLWLVGGIFILNAL